MKPANVQPVTEDDPRLTRAYIVEKLTTALRLLATGRGDARNRVAQAVFACHTLRVRDFPEPLQEDWRWIVREATKSGPYRNRWSADNEVMIGSVDNTMRNRTNATAAKIAERIWSLYWAMSDNLPYD